MDTTPTDPQVRAFVDDLVGRLGDVVETSTLQRAIYSTDASNYRVIPAVVVIPRSRDDVIDAVRVARSHGIPVTGRGGGTSCAGNAVGAGVVIDFSRHLNRVISIDPDTATAVVEPGVVLSSLQCQVQPFGLRFGPDPSTATRCTIGGMIGTPAAHMVWPTGAPLTTSCP